MIKKLLGRDVLQQAEVDVEGLDEEHLLNFLKETVVEINKRKSWILKRKTQIELLKELQQKAVREFDTGRFTQTYDELKSALSKIKNERVSPYRQSNKHHHTNSGHIKDYDDAQY